MRYRTAVKTGRTAQMQLELLRARPFRDYAAMVDRLSAVYVRPLSARLVMQERSPAAPTRRR